MLNRSKQSRRSFLGVAAGAEGASAALSFGGRSIFGATPATNPTNNASGDPLYKIIVLGDLHYDRPEHHDMDWVRKEKGAGDEHQIVGYCQVTANHTPKLFERVRTTIQQSPVPVPFIIQVGDLVEGLCGSYDLAARQFNDAFAAIESAKFGVPLLMCKGNHDITGPGAPEAFEKVLLPWLGRQAGQGLSSAAYSYRHGDDLFVFFDAYQPDLSWLDAQFQSHADARHTFLIVHEPVVPYDDRSNWIVYASEKEHALREQLLKLIGARGAIVLGGHIHKYSLLTRHTSAGAFPQLAVCSIVRDDQPRPRNILNNVVDYSDQLLKLEPNFSPASLDERRKILLDEKPEILKFEYADLSGYAILNVYANRVTADIFSGTSVAPWRTRQIDGN